MILEVLLPGVRAERRRRRRVASLPDLLETIARELRAGRNLHDAVAAAAADPVAGASGVGDALAQVAAGRGLGEALDRWARELHHRDADLIRAVLTLAAGTGGAMAVSIERAAGTLRERAAAHDEIAALTAQVRVSAALLAAAPVGFFALVAAVDPAVVALLLRDQRGWAALVVGLALDGLGFWWMHRMIRAVRG